MQRRKFIQNLALFTGGLALTKFAPANVFGQTKKKIKGHVLSAGQGVKNVVVSDGYSVVATDKNGKYEFEPHVDAVAVFISTPSGYAFKNKKGIARHYRLLKDVNIKKAINFDLVPLGVNDDEHQFIIWADPQTRNAIDVEKLMSQSVPDVKKFVADAGTGALLHGITVGDIVWDDLKLFEDYDRAIEKIGIPFFQCLGNHDMDYNLGGDETSDNTFQQIYGPTYYSFNRGKVHYVVIDDVRYLGSDRNYDGHISQQQLDWLQKDLSFVSKEKLIVLCLHIPVHGGVKNRNDLYALLDDRNVHIMSGHTHWHANIIKGNIYEHNHGTVCGAWWTGPICGDGTPCGYGIYKVKGTELSWHYQSTGSAADHQFNIFVSDFNAVEKQVKVNIWNYDPAWKTEYWVDGIQKGSLEQYEGFDPVAYATMLGKDLPNPRGFAEPRMTDHLFRAFIPVTAKEITITAIDRFGKKYTATHNI
ncbi:MAG TPA: calcineurin-like phosphoesterase family protein [Chitinophagaceae bacterium]|nr:calcineurin-like phosphoesterase family protein [Chitinophagaceae bacterium]